MMRHKKKASDCGCGKKDKCITKSALKGFVKSELKRLDCGCGCKGVKGFVKKYSGGSILADCPPGWRNDGLTCVEPCREGERDDGLTCRKPCAPGQIDDGLTCRNPIQSSTNDCPDGSRDIAGTCWGTVRQDCVDDCFNHPAPGCRTYECGRLKGAFGEDWGPRLCTDCNLRCGQTCWDVQGITKQLHERQLKVWGGEVFGQEIRSKKIVGRVNFDELGKELEIGLTQLFSDDGPLARSFDPDKNGVNEAFRKFGDDMKSVLEDVGNRIKEGFDRMGDDARRAFEDFARNAERDFKKFGDDFVAKMKDPDFWVEAVGIMAMIAGAAVSLLVTVGTLGIGAPAAAGIMAAASMVGPAARMIAKAAKHEPIDGLDIAQLAIAATTAFIPGMGPMTQAAMKVATTAASFTISAVRVGQALDLIPPTCLAYCPPPEPAGGPPEPPIKPDPEGNSEPPAPGQLSDKEILALQPDNTVTRYLKRPRRENPDYKSSDQWIAEYRTANYGNVPTPPDVPLESEEDKAIREQTNVGPPEQTPIIPADIIDENADVNLIEETVGDLGIPADELEETVELDLGIPADELDLGIPADELDEVPTELDLGIPADELDLGIPADELVGGAELFPIEIQKEGDEYYNYWGSMRSKEPRANIPLTSTGQPFNPECYARNNPSVAEAVGNDFERLTTHWIEIGSKQGYNAECG